MPNAPTRAALRLDSFRAAVTDAPVSYSVFSAFSFFGARRGGELPGPWLVRALGELGHATPAIRQTLYRMERAKELTSRLDGRTKHYRLTPAARAEAQAGLAKIMEEDDEPWDERWTIVYISPASDERVERERLLEIVRAEGFAAMGNGVYLHPRDRAARLIEAAEASAARDLLEVFRATRIGDEPPRDVIARYWDLSALSKQYERFVARYQPLVSDRRALEPRVAFALRFAVVFEFLETAWRDPKLVPALMPADWPGGRAQRIARGLYDRLLPAAIAHANRLIDDLGYGSRLALVQS